MAVRRFDLEAGGDTFEFASETEGKISFWLAKYPEAVSYTHLTLPTKQAV